VEDGCVEFHVRRAQTIDFAAFAKQGLRGAPCAPFSRVGCSLQGGVEVTSALSSSPAAALSAGPNSRHAELLFANGACPPTRQGYSKGVQAFELPRVPLHEDAHGVVRVVGSRVTLDSVVAVFDRGATPEEVVQSFPSLGLGDVYAILAWVVSRRADVDAYLARRASEEQGARHDAERRSPTADLREKLLARRGSHSA